MSSKVAAFHQEWEISKTLNITLWAIQIGVAGMFFLAGGSKLAGSEPMVQLFQTLGMGQWFRYLTGFMEVVGAVLLLLPRLSGLGGILLAGVMAGAIATHVFLIGGSTMMPIILLSLSAFVAWSRRADLLRLLSPII